MPWPPPTVEPQRDDLTADVSQGLMWMFVIAAGFNAALFALMVWLVAAESEPPGEFWTIAAAVVGASAAPMAKIADGLVSNIQRRRTDD